MRLLLSSLLLGLMLLASPARAWAPDQHPNSRYNGTTYVIGDTDVRSDIRRTKRHVHRGHRARTSRAHHSRLRQHHAAAPVKEFRADLSEFGKNFISFGGLMVDVGANGGLTLAAVIADATAKIANAVIIEPVKKTLTAAGRLIQFFLDRGYPRPAAYAIAGHIRAESNFNTKDVGDGGRARYLAQWHPDRQRGLKRLAAKKGTTPYDYETNLEYIDHELRTSETLAYRELSRARSLDDAVAAFAHFERPRGYNPSRPRRIHDWNTRLNFARKYAREYEHLNPVVIGGL